MNYLELVQRTAQEAGMADAPLTVIGQRGEFKRVCDWVRDAWNYVESNQGRKWSWQWEEPELVLPANAYVLPATVPASRYDTEQALDISASGGEFGRRLDYLPWREFSQVYTKITHETGLTAWTVRPDGAIVFNGTRPEAHTIRFQRWRLPRPLVVDMDVPAMPEHYHMLIVWQAICDYAGYDEAGGQLIVAEKKKKELWSGLMAECLPQLRFGPPLA